MAEPEHLIRVHNVSFEGASEAIVEFLLLDEVEDKTLEEKVILTSSIERYDDVVMQARNQLKRRLAKYLEDLDNIEETNFRYAE